MGDDNNNGNGEILPCWYPRTCCKKQPVYDGNIVALGWIIDLVARAVAIIGAGAFLANALLNLAKEEAGCDPNAVECDGRAFGIRPSSLITTYTVVVGIVSTSIMPLVGAVVDYTSVRLKLGRILSVAFSLFLVVTPFVGPKTWFPIAICQILVSSIGWAISALSLAYLPEIETDKDKLNKLNANFTIVQFACMVVFLMAVVAASQLFGLSEDNLATARLGMGSAAVLGVIGVNLAWFGMYESRPAMRELPEGASLWTEGFKQLYRTSRNIARNYKGLMWFYIAVALGEAAVQSLVTIGITFMTDTLNFTSSESGLVVLCLMLGCVPGGYASGIYIERFKRPVFGAVLACLGMTLGTIFAAVVLRKPGQQVTAYCFALVWGFFSGWKYTVERFLSSTMIPPNQNSELMGVFMFATQCLSWLPPLVFTAMNESGIHQRVSMGTVATYFVMAIVAFCMIGSYEEALRQVGRDSYEKAEADGNDDVEEIKNTAEFSSKSSPDVETPQTKAGAISLMKGSMKEEPSDR
uniref:Major facilitator superfamily (MFS) profile domain-containing protein n=1 Tax=Grammatophora oceanica TaxID=210454 RepID=A0A7S1YC20_9STRA|mmetsp:Transcript_38384/g.57099  ORF Transcript_38384/g.57099 Transcript_38384/m.57099 type:complete len:524 (+) Transcript_38384:431-2002(+)|eukprot:CAMPEP_0194034104 /NCGR_PEP_ID=MMETSP0009_2-20130614/6506_1 /TAXON_ID=210454 /ORGANISM="Grammatophora oceanica, Strain CCMP 410" /LENGTH=523 /DNA_ID=CAMNT_0038674861 /DNA_START=424 /DNA_END=1995 /DNA_ORIENTATION=+